MNPRLIPVLLGRGLVFLALATLAGSILIGGFFLSVDGPLHAFTAGVIRGLPDGPASEFFEARPDAGPPTNLLSTLVLNGLAPHIGPTRAEAWLVLAAVGLLGAAFAFLAKPGGLGRLTMGLLGCLMGVNYFLFYGFYNFCLAAALALPVLRVVHRKRHESWLGCLGWGVLLMISVLAHPLPALVVGFVLGLETMVVLIRERGRGAMGWLGKDVLLLGGAALLVAWFFVVHPPEPGGERQAAPDLLRFFLTAGFLFPLSKELDPVRIGVLVGWLWALVLTGWLTLRSRQWNPCDLWIGAAGILTGIAFAVPDVTSGGSFLQIRLVFFAWTLGVFWLDAAVAHGLGPVVWLRRIFLLVALAGVWGSAAEVRRWKEDARPVLAAIDQAASRARDPGWIVRLPVSMPAVAGALPWTQHIHLHAALSHPGLLPLPYYHAWAPHFPVSYRADRFGNVVQSWTVAVPRDWSPAKFAAESGFPVVLVVAEGITAEEMGRESPILAEELAQDYEAHALDPQHLGRGWLFIRK